MGVPLTKMWRTQEKPHVQELKPLVPRPPTLPTKAMGGGDAGHLPLFAKVPSGCHSSA